MKIQKISLLCMGLILIASLGGCRLFGIGDDMSYLESQLPESFSAVTIDDLPGLDSTTAVRDISGMTDDDIADEGMAAALRAFVTIPFQVMAYMSPDRDMNSDMLMEVALTDEVLEEEGEGSVWVNEAFFGVSQTTSGGADILQAITDAVLDDDADTNALDELSDDNFEVAYFCDGEALQEDEAQDKAILSKSLLYMNAEGAANGEHSVKGSFESSVAMHDKEDTDYYYIAADFYMKDIKNTFDLDELSDMLTPSRDLSRRALPMSSIDTASEIEELIALVWGEYSSDEDYFTLDVEIKGVDDSGAPLTVTKSFSDWELFELLLTESD